MDEPNIGPINVGDIENRIIQELYKGRRDISGLAKNINISKSAVCFVLNGLISQGIVDNGKYNIIIPATHNAMGLARKTYRFTKTEQEFYQKIYG